MCREQVAELRPHIDDLRRAGGELVIVGSGAPHFAKAFREDLKIEDVTIFSDEELRAYQLAGFRRGLWTLLTPRAIANYVRAIAGGHRQRRTQGDPLQQGGVLVVKPGGEVIYRFVSRASGDHPKPATLVAALASATGKS